MSREKEYDNIKRTLKKIKAEENDTSKSNKWNIGKSLKQINKIKEWYNKNRMIRCISLWDRMRDHKNSKLEHKFNEYKCL